VIRLCALSLLLLLGCAAEPAPERFDFGLPARVPAPRAPAANPMSRAKVELGRRLFAETRLSIDQTRSCASCHRPELAFTDGLTVARGHADLALPRNTQSLLNAAYFTTFTWANPRLRALEGQALVPLLASTPRELGVATAMTTVRARLRDDPTYVALFAQAFGEPDGIRTANIIAALACYERTLLSYEAPYDAFVAGDRGALTASAQRGQQLFASSRLHCSSCHAGRLFSDADAPEPVFHNVGLYNLAGRGAYPRDNQGLYELTHRPRDMGKFRTPSLRNVALTAPYMHDGSIASLDEVLDHYAAGGRTLFSGPRAGVGADNPYKDKRIAGFLLSPRERADLLAFLHGLTDVRYALTADQSARP
jgi:cytochrome c peroxidase